MMRPCLCKEVSKETSGTLYFKKRALTILIVNGDGLFVG